MDNVDSKSMYLSIPPIKAIDGEYGDHSSFFGFKQIGFHSGKSFGEWWKVYFKERVAIVKVHFYNRQDCCSERSNNLSINALTTTNGLTTEKLCANTGIMENVPDKMFYCETLGTLADELKVMNQIDMHLVILEVLVYGWDL